MNDRELEKDVKEAFDGVSMPEGAKQQALDYIMAQGQEATRAQAQDGAQDCVQDDAQGCARPRPDAWVGGHPSPSSEPAATQPDPVEFAAAMAPASRRKRSRWKVAGVVGGAVAACLVLTLAVFGATQLPNLAPQAAGSGPPASEPAASEPAAPGSDSSNPPAAARSDLEPTAFVDIDINPSVQLKLNSSDCVVGAEGINDDGNSLLSAVSVDGLPYGQALRALTSSEALAPYVDGDPFISLSVSSSSQDQKRALTDASEQYLASCPYQGSCNGVSQRFYDEAHSHGMGCGRYAAAVRLSQLDPSLTLDDCSRMSMRELYDRIAECEAAAAGQGDERSQNGGSGSGSDQDTAPDQGYGQGYGYGHHEEHGSHHGRC